MSGLFFASAQDRLAALDAHIALSYHSIAEQAARIAALKAEGRNTAGASNRLSDMMEILDGLHQQRHRLVAVRWRSAEEEEAQADDIAA
jgi:hypothetical protein